MHDREIIKGLEETKIMLTQAVDRGGEMAVMGAFKCITRVTDAIALLKEQEKRINELEKKLRLLEYGDQDTLQSIMMPAT